MIRARVGFAAALVATALCADAVLAGQAVPVPQLTPVLAGRKFTPPVKGSADIEFTAPITTRIKDSLVTKITVRNVSSGPIARLTINDIWYDKAGQVLTAGRGVINGLLQKQEIQTLTFETPWKAGMNAQQRKSLFTHANGDVKLHVVKKLEPAKEDAAAAPPPAASK